MRRSLPMLVSSLIVAHGAAADDVGADVPAAPPSPDHEPTEPAPDPDAPTAAEIAGDIIVVTGTAPPLAGTISIDGRVARQAPGALGEPLRALALLPGVTTSIAASGYPIIRGTLPGESRFLFDGIEVPQLYHLLLGNQVIHPSFIAGLELRAGGHAADHGHMLGGLVTMTPTRSDRPITELRANLVEIGAFRAQPLSRATSIAVAARVGTLAGAAKLYDSDTTVHYVDQQTRLVHRLRNGDELTLTSLGAYDYVRFPPEPAVRTIQLGFHRLDARWSHAAHHRRLRAGIQTEVDTLRSVVDYPDVMAPGLALPPGELAPSLPTARRGGRSYGVRAYADGSVPLASWLTMRSGVEAQHRALVHHAPMFGLTRANDPLFELARSVDREAVWSALEVRVGPLRITPSLRGDSYHAALSEPVRHANLDPRLAIAAYLPNGGQLELAGGVYSAPPQVSVTEGAVVIGPLPTAEGTAAAAGLSRGVGAQASIRTPLGGDLEGSFAAHYRDTDYAVDFGMLDKPLVDPSPCASFASSETSAYRDVGIRALGVEAMVRGAIGRSVTGWVSYSLGKVDRDLGFARLPHDFDQRHTLSATAQWRRGGWLFGASGHVRTGRPVVYPQWVVCTEPDAPPVAVVRDPTHLRRLPAAWRVDLRAERAFRFSGWNMRLYIEMQNANLSEEVLGYGLVSDDASDPSSFRVVEDTLFIPLPMIGVDVEL